MKDEAGTDGFNHYGTDRLVISLASRQPRRPAMTPLTQKEAGPSRLKARDAFCQGDIAAAIATQRALIDATRQDPHPGDYLFLASMLSASRDHKAVRHLMLEGHGIWPEEPSFVGGIGLSEAHLRRWPEAIQWLDRAITLTPTDANLHDCMARVCGELGDLEGAREHGETSLTLKDAATAKMAPAVALADVPVPPFRPDTQERNVIAFSLFGDKERYCTAALENARIAPQIYPGWQCRFYCDMTVPAPVRSGLQAAGVQIVLKSGQQRLYEGLFWRFHVANDPNVDRYLVRDCDSLVNPREARAVQGLDRERPALPRHARLLLPQRADPGRHVGRRARCPAGFAASVRPLSGRRGQDGPLRPALPARNGLADGPGTAPASMTACSASSVPVPSRPAPPCLRGGMWARTWRRGDSPMSGDVENGKPGLYQLCRSAPRPVSRQSQTMSISAGR